MTFGGKPPCLYSHSRQKLFLASSLGGWLVNDGQHPVNQDNLRQSNVEMLEVGPTVSELYTQAPTLFVALFKNKGVEM